MINSCILTSLLYLIPLSYLLYTDRDYLLCFLFLSLSVFGFLNHYRTYTDKPRYDFIDIIDRILILIITSYFIFYHYQSYIVWVAVFYMIISYLYIIPLCQNRQVKVIIHSSFHFVTSICSLLLFLLI